MGECIQVLILCWASFRPFIYFQLILQLMICSDHSTASYWYNFDSNYWSAVYKHVHGKDFKFKAGYDSEVRLGWASLWVSTHIFFIVSVIKQIFFFIFN